MVSVKDMSTMVEKIPGSVTYLTTTLLHIEPSQADDGAVVKCKAFGQGGELAGTAMARLTRISGSCIGQLPLPPTAAKVQGSPERQSLGRTPSYRERQNARIGAECQQNLVFSETLLQV